MPRAAVAQIVAVDTGDHDVFQPERGDRVAEVAGLVRIGRQRTAVSDVAERASARAEVAEDHESRRALAEAFADVRARRFLADRVQLLLAQDSLDLLKA